jgi:hypothetical protein
MTYTFSKQWGISFARFWCEKNAATLQISATSAGARTELMQCAMKVGLQNDGGLSAEKLRLFIISRRLI